jgi:Na+/proline symporter
VAGTATIKNVTKDASDEFCTLIIATLFGCYSFIGGLGTTFYVSYFNTVSIYVCLIIISHK